MAEKKISQATLKKSFRNWAYGNLTCFSQEHMQTFGYLAAMLPVVDELYDNDEDKVNSLRTYTTFFNTEPQIGTLVVGLTAGLEEARANGEPLDDETINGIRAASWASPSASPPAAPCSDPCSTSSPGTSRCTSA